MKVSESHGIGRVTTQATEEWVLDPVFQTYPTQLKTGRAGNESWQRARVGGLLFSSSSVVSRHIYLLLKVDDSALPVLHVYKGAEIVTFPNFLLSLYLRKFQRDFGFGAREWVTLSSPTSFLPPCDCFLLCLPVVL